MCLAALSLTVGASPAPAAVTVGQVGAANATCSSGEDWAQPFVSSGNSYVVPGIPPATALRITSWSHQAFTGTGRRLKLKVYRPVAGLTFTVVDQEVRDLTPDVLNTFPTSIAVKAGDVLGITTAADSTGTTGCGIGPFGETNYRSIGDHPNGAEVSFFTGVGWRLNVSAVVEPTNTFSLGGTRRNKNKGVVTLTATVPNPGELTGSGKGVKASGAAETSKAVNAGQAKLTIRAKGKKLKTLNETGKVKLSVTVTYAPTGGDPSTQSIKVKLKKKL